LNKLLAIIEYRGNYNSFLFLHLQASVLVTGRRGRGKLMRKAKELVEPSDRTLAKEPFCLARVLDK
jgi:hypothetical protein